MKGFSKSFLLFFSLYIFKPACSSFEPPIVLLFLYKQTDTQYIPFRLRFSVRVIIIFSWRRLTNKFPTWIMIIIIMTSLKYTSATMSTCSKTHPTVEGGKCLVISQIGCYIPPPTQYDTFWLINTFPRVNSAWLLQVTNHCSDVSISHLHIVFWIHLMYML